MTTMAERKRAALPARLRVEPAPYDLEHPMAVAPERLRKDPRIEDQRLTAFWVTLRGQHVGRVVMTEFEDKSGWWYQPEVCDPAGEKLPDAFGDPFTKRKDAVLAVLEEWRGRLRAHRRAQK